MKPSHKFRKWSVLLIDTVGDGYFAWVEAPGPRMAESEARMQAARALSREAGEFEVMLTIKGHHHDLSQA